MHGREGKHHSLHKWTIHKVSTKSPTTSKRCYAYSMTVIQEPLTQLNRRYLIAALIGEYEYLCHDDSQVDDMTPAEHFQMLTKASDAELIEDSDINDSSFFDIQDFYDFYAAYVPDEYSVT